MSTRKIISLICLCLTGLLIGNLFLPFISNGDISYSLWDYLGSNADAVEADIIILIELIGALVVFLLQMCNVMEDAKFAYFSNGYMLTYHVVMLINMLKHEQFKYLSVGFYVGFIVSLTIFILLIVSSFVSNKKKEKIYANYTPQIIGYDPKTGQPIIR